MRAFFKFLINVGLIFLVVWLVSKYTTLDDKLIALFQKSPATISTQVQTGSLACTTPWGTTIPDGANTVAYSLGTGGKGMCQEEMRVCEKGVLKGSYVLQACPTQTQSGQNTTGFAVTPTGVACSTPRGQLVAHGSYIVAYKSASSCVFQRRVCDNGKLLGSFTYNYCLVAQNSQSVANAPLAQNIVTQQPTIGNPVLPANTNVATSPVPTIIYGGGIANKEQTKDYWNDTAKGNVAVVDSRNTTTYNPRSTQDTTSTYQEPKYVHYDLTQQGCNTPWGTFVDNGQYVIAYKVKNAPAGHSCEYERRTCTQGKLGGTFTYSSCTIKGATYDAQTWQGDNQGYDKYIWLNSPSVVRPSNQACSLPRGGTIANGDYIRTYKYRSAPWADGCEGEVRYCHNGVLDGSYSNSSCRLVTPSYQGCYGRQCNTVNGNNNTTVSTRDNSCSLPRGGTISNGLMVRAYLSYNGRCYAENRTCTNGWLQGSYVDKYCSMSQSYPNLYNNDTIYNNSYSYGNRDCSLPRGGYASNGQLVEAYATDTPPCYKQIRQCVNGVLQGSYSYGSCYESKYYYTSSYSTSDRGYHYNR